MKWLPLILFLLVIGLSAKGQNLVFNPSFEQYSSCPPTIGLLGNATGWNGFIGSCDYYNPCAVGSAGVPGNFLGNQNAYRGNAYAGLIAMEPNNIKECVYQNIQALAPRGRYEFSMYISLADYSRYATDNLGVYFKSNVQLPRQYPPAPHIALNTIVTDTTSWVQVTGTFIADSAYEYMIIGGFGTWATIGKTLISSSKSFNGSYYYIDSVTLISLSKMVVPYADTLACAGDTLIVPYQVLKPVFATTNTFTLQLSNASGSFINPITIGSITSNVSGIIKAVIPATVTPGTGYRVRLVSSDVADTSTDNGRDIIVGVIRPVKPEATSNSPVCSYDTLSLSTSSLTPGVTWTWLGPNGFKYSKQDTSIIHPLPAASGYYFVTARLFGCLARDTTYVSVIQVPQPVTATCADTLCELDTLKLFSNPIESGIGYSWTGPNNFSSSLQNPVIPRLQMSAIGAYIVVASRSGCTATDTTSFLFAKLAPLVNAASNGPLCNGTTLNLSTTIFSPGASYNWTGPNGYSSLLANPGRTNVNAGMSGDYIVKGELNGCFNYDTTTVLIYPVTPAPTASNNSPVCAGGDIKLNASAIPNASYEWNGPGLFYSTAQNAIRSNAALVDGGTYTVTAKVNGCASAPVNTVVTVAKGPEILIYPNPGDSLCPGWSVSFAAVPKNAGASQSFEWYKNGIATGSTGQTYNAGIPNDGDSFYVRMTAGSVCNTPINSSPIKITVLPVHTPPTISISADPGAHVWPGLEVKFKAQTGNAGAHPGYQWQRNSQDIPNAKDSILKADYLKTGDTICCLVSSNYLCAVPRDVLSNCLVMNVDVGVEELGIRSKEQVYPNPNDGNFTIESSENGMLQITNLQGQVVHEQTVVKGVNTIRLRQAKGIYMVRIANEQGQPTARKIIIE